MKGVNEQRCQLSNYQMSKQWIYEEDDIVKSCIRYTHRTTYVLLAITCLT